MVALLAPTFVAHSDKVHSSLKLRQGHMILICPAGASFSTVQ
jgi:hypothetical protein